MDVFLSLIKEINRLISKGMSNIYSKVTIEQNWRSLKLQFSKFNKNTMTGPAISKKTTRHHAHLSLCAKSRKTNDTSRENGQRPSGIFLTISRPNISKLQFFLKNRFHSNWRLYLVLTSGQSRFWEKYQGVWLWANFANISKSRIFFRLCDFSTFIVP